MAQVVAYYRQALGVGINIDFSLMRLFATRRQFHTTLFSLQRRHNGRAGVWNHQPHDCLLIRLFGGRSKKTSKLRVTGLCAGNFPMNSPHKGPETRKCFHFMTSSCVEWVSKSYVWYCYYYITQGPMSAARFSSSWLCIFVLQRWLQLRHFARKPSSGRSVIYDSSRRWRIQAEMKILPFCRWPFKVIHEKSIYSFHISLEFVLYKTYPIFGSDCVFITSRYRYVTWARLVNTLTLLT